MNTGWTPRTKFETECIELGLIPSQVAMARNFGRDMIAEKLHQEECNDNGFGNCHCSHCNGAPAPVVDNEPIPF